MHLGELAARLRFEFIGDRGADASAYRESTLWDGRVNPRIRNVIRGITDEGRLVYFDSFLHVGEPETSISACACHGPYRFERLALGMQTGFLGRDIPKLACTDYVELDSAEFTRTFAVECADKKFAYDILHQRAMEFLLKRPTIRMNLFGDCVLFWYERRLPVKEVEGFIADTREFARMLPGYLADRGRA